MVDVDRRAVFVAGLAATSFISNTTASAQQAAAGSPEARLRELGIELPKVTPPVANYVPSARLGSIIFLAGAGPLNPDGSRPQGKVGRDVTLEQANRHARNAGLHCSRRCGRQPEVLIGWFASAECSAW
jgi:enamine deaminase RidA (YjgF/YER057c/UK114 family)